MTIQEIVDPERIEPELLKIWEGLGKANKTRASLFNLIVFNQLSPRTDYFRNIVQKVVEKFPCRTLFISQDPDTKQNYLKTAISVVFPNAEDKSIACDQIDIGVAGNDIAKVPFLILPHLLPDLPIYVLWTEDPSKQHALFTPLTRLATRIIFDSESADNLFNFSKTILALHKETSVDIGDLNWARTQGWRDLISFSFTDLKAINALQFVYNARENVFFCHLKIQAMYLLAWLSSRLQWTLEKADKNLQFSLRAGTQKIAASIASTTWEKLGSGTVISVQIETSAGKTFLAARIPERYHYVQILLASQESCELPYQYLLGQTATGQSLVKEICTRGTSAHYLDMLKELLILDKDKLC